MWSEIKIPEHLEGAIMTPHDHEDESHRPLWILWKHLIGADGRSDGPQIDCICDTERSARYHVMNLLDWIERSSEDISLHVERVPANHRFASSMADAFADPTLMRLYSRKGD
jgi:hypothetical protein